RGDTVDFLNVKIVVGKFVRIDSDNQTDFVQRNNFSVEIFWGDESRSGEGTPVNEGKTTAAAIFLTRHVLGSQHTPSLPLLSNIAPRASVRLIRTALARAKGRQSAALYVSGNGKAEAWVALHGNFRRE